MTSAVSNLDEAYVWSINKIAQAFGMARRTVTQRIRQAGVAPSGWDRGNPKYAIKDVGPILFTEAGSYGGDPEELPPQDRRAYYQSENERLKFERETGQLVQIDDMRIQVSGLCKTVASSLDSLPDVLERDCGIEGHALERVQEVVDGVREELYLNIVDPEDDE